MFVIVNNKGYQIHVDTNGVKLTKDVRYFSTIKELTNYIAKTCTDKCNLNCEHCPIYHSQYRLYQSIHPTPPKSVA